VVPDNLGNLYVAEQGNNAIRKITTAGVVSTYAEDGAAGFVNGAALSAEFNDPEGMAIDKSGNLYVADAQNNVIRKITTAGVVSTYAGSGTSGLQNGTALSAEFAGPNGLAIDTSGNLYVADFFNNVIREITPAGMVSTYAGNGTKGFINGAAGTAEFSIPSGMAIDTASNLYIAEVSNKVIRKITPAGDVSTYASGFEQPIRVAVDAPGNIYVSDASVNDIIRITYAGIMTTYAGNGTPGFTDGTALTAEFNTPGGIAIDASGNLYIADYGNDRIRKITP
jgi:sugar lactone lactonase YvrE